MADFIEGALAGQDYRLNKLKLLEAPVKLEQEKLALKISQQSYDQRQQLANFLNQHDSKIPDGMNPLENAANSLVQLGDAEIKSGMIEEGAKTLAHAGTITAQVNDAAYKNWQQVKQQTDFATKVLSGVTDQASFDQANAFVRMSTGKPSALEGQKYSPELIETLQRSIATKRTAAQEALTRAQTKDTEQRAKADAVLPGLRKAQEDLANARKDNLVKAGGDGQIAKPKNIAAVSDYLIKDSGDVMTRADSNVFARDIALDVERRMKEDNQTQAQAVTSAVDWAKKHGALAGIPPAHARPGASVKKPLPLPKDASGYKDQMFYEVPNQGSMWYDAETKSLYKPGEGPGDDEEEDDE